MKIAVFGGSFNPPHIGHVAAAESAVRFLQPDRLLIVPARKPPHKDISADDPSAQVRAELCRCAFAHIPCAEVSELELCRESVSYTIDTLRQIRESYPEDELYLLLGADMLENFTQWHAFDEILRLCTLAVFGRGGEEDKAIDTALEQIRCCSAAEVLRIPHEPVSCSSSQIRPLLAKRTKPEMLPDAVYAEIIRRRCYAAKPDLRWLREESCALHKPKRVPHVRGTEEEAVRLAERWGADIYDAAEAAILHDITKKLGLNEQLILCEEYGIITDTAEAGSEKLLHSKTGAALARARFGVSEAVYEAIRWHTTGRAGMSLLEKIIYIADYIEPTRDFDGVEPLRKLAYSNLDEAMLLGLEMSLEELRGRSIEPHPNSVAAMEELRRQIG